MPLPTHIYHLAEAANWPSIQRLGLLPAHTLIARSGLPTRARRQLDRAQRLTHTTLPTGIRIRDQRPLPAAALKRCLVHMQPAQWYALLNAHIFFWLDIARLNRQRRACAHRPQIVLVIDVAKLLAAHSKHIRLTPINTGNARRRPALRGPTTFVPYPTWLQSAWLTESAALKTTPRPRSHPPVELALHHSLPDAHRFITSTHHLVPHQLFTPR